MNCFFIEVSVNYIFVVRIKYNDFTYILGHLRTICKVLHSYFNILGCLFQFLNVHDYTKRKHQLYMGIFENDFFMSIVVNLVLKCTYYSSSLRKSKGCRLTSFTACKYNKWLRFFRLRVSGGSTI